MNWELQIIFGITALAIIGIIGLKIYDAVQWVRRVERNVRESERLKTRVMENECLLEELQRKMDTLRKDFMEEQKFSHEVQTELYDTYDTLVEMIHEVEA